MSSRPCGAAYAREQARHLWIHCGRPAPGQMNLEAVAAAVGLTVVRGTLEGAVARLTYRNGSGFVRIGGDQRPARTRFSIAHELGHAWLHKDSTWCNDADLNGLHGDVGKEGEANAFAAELLMPHQLIETIHRGKPLTMELILDVAARFGVSATAAALGLVSVTSAPCALVMCSHLGRAHKSTVNWCHRHADFWPSVGAIVPSESSAHTARLGPTPEKELEIDSWCLRPRYPTKQVLFEEVLPIRSMDAALVLLTLNDPS